MSFLGNTTLSLKLGNVAIELRYKFLIGSDVLAEVGILLSILAIIKFPICLRQYEAKRFRIVETVELQTSLGELLEELGSLI